MNSILKHLYSYKIENKRKVLRLFGIKIYSKKEYQLAIHKNVFRYLNNYKYVLDNVPQYITSDEYKDVIWQCWWQGIDNAPNIVKKCFESVKLYSNKKVIIIDRDNFDKYIKIPEHIMSKFEKGIISFAHFSDYIRCSLLSKYGGTWIDSTVLLTGKIPDIIFKQDFFQFSTTFWCNVTHIPSNKMFDKMLDIAKKSGGVNHTGSNWFLHAAKGNLIINVIRYFLEEYWKKEDYVINYFIFHYFLTFAILNNNDCKDCYSNMIKINNYCPHFLQNSLNDNFNLSLYNEIKKISNIHKLTYKFKDGITPNSFLEHILK